MEHLIKKVQLGQEGNAVALKELGLEKVTPIKHVHLSTANLEKLRKQFKLIAETAYAARQLGHRNLQHASEYLLGIVLFVTKFKLKKKLHYTPQLFDILEMMDTLVSSMKTFLTSIEDTDGAAHLTKIRELLQKARNGDKDSVSFFELEELPSITVQTIKNVPHFSALQNCYQCYDTYAQVGQHLKDDVFRTVASGICSYIAWMARETHPTRQLLTPIDGPDICTTLLDELNYLQRFVADSRLKVRQYEGKEIIRELRTIEEEEDDPNYNPEEDTDSSSEDSEVTDVQHHPSSEPVTTVSSSKEKVQKATTKPVTATKRKADEHQAKTKSSSQPPAKKPKVTASETSTDTTPHGKRSHHSMRICPVCNKPEGNLKRHLESHAKKGLIEPDAVQKILSVTTRKGKRRGPRRASQDTAKKGLKMKWCPMPGCDFVTHHLRSHLTHRHRLKQGTLLEKCVAVAEEYEGQAEVDDMENYIRTYSKKSKSRFATSSTATSSTATCTATSPTESPSPCESPSASQSPLASSVAAAHHQEPLQKDHSDSVAQPDEPTSPVADAHQREASSDEDPNTVRQYFEAKEPTNDRHWWLLEFFKYLNLSDCGRKKSKNQLQHASQVRCILEELDPRGEDIEVLSQDEGYHVWTDFVDPKMDHLKGGTIRSYLGSYELFLHFVTTERVRQGQVPQLSQDTLRIFRNTIPRLKGWRRTVDIEKKPQRTEDILRECDTRLSTKDVQDFMSSEVVKRTQKMYERAAYGHVLTISEVCDCRDYLTTMITLKTGTRPGALLNATMQHYSSMRDGDSGRYKVMLVPRHKRGVSGPAPLPLNAELQQLLQTYVEHIRPQLGNSPSSDYLFLTSEGLPFLDKNMSRRLPEFWRKSGIRSDLRVTATNIRKWIVTVAHQKQVEGANIDIVSLRQSMCHSARAAEHFYLREDLTRTGTIAADIIELCADVGGTKNSSATMPAVPEEVENVPASAQPSPLTSSVADVHHRKPSDQDGRHSVVQPATQSSLQLTSEADAHHREASDKDDSDSDSDVPLSVKFPQPKPQVRPLTPKEKEAVSELFGPLIASQRMVTLAEIRPTLKKHSVLQNLLSIDGMDRRVADRIRACQAKAEVSPTDTRLQKIPSEGEPTEPRNPFQFVDEEPHTKESSTGRLAWDVRDNQIISDRFLQEKNYPGIYKAVAIFQETSELRRIYEDNGKSRCIEKVKNIFKTRKR